MFDLTPREPQRPLFWPDVILDIQELLADSPVSIYIVGGAVRDALLHRPLKDIDLAVASASIKLGKRIADHWNVDFYVMDQEREVTRSFITTSEGQFVIDIARFRGDDLAQDLFDRDFTLNALAVDLASDLAHIIDPLNGQDDAIKRLIRRCHANSIAHDPIRGLRAIRQSIQLNGHIERETKNDIRAQAAKLFDVSPERVRDEFIKMLSVERPAASLRVADALGLLALIVPEAAPLHDFPVESAQPQDAWQFTLKTIENLGRIFQTISTQRSDNTAASFTLGMLALQIDRYRPQLQEHLGAVWPNQRTNAALLLLGALLYGIIHTHTTKPDLTDKKQRVQIVEQAAEHLRLSNDEKLRLRRVVGTGDDVPPLENLDPLTIYRYWRRTGEAGVDCCLLALALHLTREGVELNQKRWLNMIERTRLLFEAYYTKREQLVAPPQMIAGDKLAAALNLATGPIIGTLLEVIREGQVTGAVQSEDDAIHIAQEYLAHNNYS